MNFEKFKNAKNNVVDVAEAGGLSLLGVVQAAGPVDGDVSQWSRRQMRDRSRRGRRKRGSPPRR